MINLSIKNNRELSQTELLDLKSLANECLIFDGVRPKVYWNNIQVKREINANYLTYLGEQLVGYLSYFLFQDDAVHISAMVHPCYRKQKIFTTMLAKAKLNIASYHYTQAIIPICRESQSSQLFIQHLNGEYLFSEYEMVRDISELEEINLTPLKFVIADQSHTELMAQMDSICFGSDYDVMLERFNNLIALPKRQVVLAQYQNHFIGKCHIRFDAYEVYLHDICILPAYRQRGYGRSLIKSAINKIIENVGVTRIILDVETENEAALQLYRDCHFEVSHIEEYWRVTL